MGNIVVVDRLLTSVAKPINALVFIILVMVTVSLVNSPYPQSFYCPTINHLTVGESDNSVRNCVLLLVVLNAIFDTTLASSSLGARMPIPKATQVFVMLIA